MFVGMLVFGILYFLQQIAKVIKIKKTIIPTKVWPYCYALVNFSSCERNLIKTFQIEGMIALITKKDLIFS